MARQLSAHDPSTPKADDHDALARLIDTLFRGRSDVPRLEIVVRAELADLSPAALDIVNLLPPGAYTRSRLCDQLNSAITAHGWGRTLGTFE
ncbi:MAG: hypothetical protein ABFC80_09090 [Coriobacteriales bacterium]|nr:hypothetical protein [Actinomycetes bacterium]